MGDNELMSIKDAAAHAGVSPQTVRRWVAAYHWQIYEGLDGRETLIRREDLEDRMRVRPVMRT